MVAGSEIAVSKALLDRVLEAIGRESPVGYEIDTLDMMAFGDLASVQRQLLESALSLVRPGGRIVFSNCSLDPLEGEDLIAGFLADHPDIERIAIDGKDWPGLEMAINARGEFRTTPRANEYAALRSGGVRGPRWASGKYSVLALRSRGNASRTLV